MILQKIQLSAIMPVLIDLEMLRRTVAANMGSRERALYSN
jgi:hypothetical protein